MVTRIRVGHEAPTAYDVLDYARGLIEAYGWNRGSRKRNTDKHPMRKSSEKDGFTLHDAVGEACTRLSQDISGAPAGTKDWTTGTKDWTIQDTEGQARNLRQEANQFVASAIASSDPGLTDMTFNDSAEDVGEIYAVLDGALAAARGGS